MIAGPSLSMESQRANSERYIISQDKVTISLTGKITIRVMVIEREMELGNDMNQT